LMKNSRVKMRASILHLAVEVTQIHYVEFCDSVRLVTTILLIIIGAVMEATPAQAQSLAADPG